MHTVPPCFYRIGIKALILNEHNEFLLCKEPNCIWELPGGGIEWSDNHKQTLEREIREEMGLKTTFIADTPSYFVTTQRSSGVWLANVIYNTKVEHFNFIESDECTEIGWFTPTTILEVEAYDNVVQFATQFTT